MDHSRARTPRTALTIEVAASRARALVGAEGLDQIDMLALFERLPQYRFGHLGKDFGSRPEAHLRIDVDVLDRELLHGANAKTLWSYGRDCLIVTLATDRYDALEKGDPEARLDVAHEIGHLAFHEQEVISSCALGHGSGLARDQDAWNVEWQAEQFGLAFLAPRHLLDLDAARPAIARRFNLSLAAVMRRVDILYKMGGPARRKA